MSNPLVQLRQDGLPLRGKDTDTGQLRRESPRITVKSAAYGVQGDAMRTRDVTAKLQKLVDAGSAVFRVSQLADGDDPAVGAIKTLMVQYDLNGRRQTATGADPDTIDLVADYEAQQSIELHCNAQGQLLATAHQPGRFELITASGQTLAIDVPHLPPPQELNGPWNLRFPPTADGSENIAFEQLTSWSDRSEPAIKYFSGTATYHKSFSLQERVLDGNRRITLDLGKVAVMAAVRVNGKDLGQLWKPPFQVDITAAVRPGENVLEVDVTNLWINRMLGDEQLPEDSKRHANGTLKEWPEWVLQGKPSPTGRHTFTSWRLWKKGEPLAISGLIGPVRIKFPQIVTLDPDARQQK